jgi:hypothetical protein
MTSRRADELVLGIYPQTSGFAFILFKGWGAPIDLGAYEVRAGDKNTRCLKRIESLLALHTPAVLVLQQMSKSDTHRAPRIQRLNSKISELGNSYNVAVQSYRRTDLLQSFSRHFEATTKHEIAQAIVHEIPALSLYLPPKRKRWTSERAHMGIFEAAALAWMYFHKGHRGAQAA